MALTIRDPIHTYINFSPLESLILDTRLVQRLRNIKQNSFVFYTYPTCQTTRFEHSLGVMKIGHTIVESVLKNSDRNILDQFFRDLSNMLNFYEGKLVYRTQNIEQLKHDLSEGVGVACLLHDAGHFPLSHLVESVFYQSIQYGFLKEENPYTCDEHFMDEWSLVSSGPFDFKLHELTTYLLVKNSKELKKIVGKNKNFQKVINIALIILNPVRELLSKIRTKHQLALYENFVNTAGVLRMILDSEIDADRFDYLTRDSVSSGVTSGDFDIERILSTIVLHKIGQNYYIFPSMKSLSAIESFYLERFKAYRWLIHHHNSIFYKRICYFILTKLMDRKSILYQINNFNNEVVLPIEQFHYSNFNNNKPINDIFLLSSFYDLYDRTAYFFRLSRLKSIKNKAQKKEKQFLNRLRERFNVDVNEDLERIKKYFEILLFRERKKLSIWKNISDYREVNSLFAKKFESFLESYNKQKEQENKTSIIKKLKLSDFFQQKETILNEIADTYLIEPNLYILQKKFLTPGKNLCNLNKNGVIFIDVVDFKPLAISEDGKEAKLKLFCPISRELKAINELSFLVDSLRKYKSERIGLYAFLVLIQKEKPLSDKERYELVKSARRVFINCLFDWLVNECKEFKAEFENKSQPVIDKVNIGKI